MIARFVDEARVVNQIGHPNIVDVFAFGQLVDGRHYFVMEWLKGESLRTRIARARMSRAEVCGIARPLARALMAAHAKGIVHRDLKPDNVFLVEVDGESTVKLLDFGIAKLAHTEHRMEQTASGAIVGTPLYIAPEQAKGLSIDHRVDVYALGCMLFEMLTGRVPFVANSALEVVALHLMEAPPRASTLVADLPRELDDLVVAMMAKDPNARPSLATVCEVVERTKHAPPESAYTSLAPRGSEKSMAGPLAAARTLPHAVPPRRKAWWIAVPVSALLLGGIAFVAVQALSSREPAATPPVAVPRPVDVAPPAAEPPPAVDVPAAVTPPPVEVPAAVTPPPVEVPTEPPPKKPPAHTDPLVHTKPVMKPKKPDKPKVEPKAGSNSGEMLLDPGTLKK
jgi:serine/threonine-protein kinase